MKQLRPLSRKHIFAYNKMLGNIKKKEKVENHFRKSFFGKGKR